MPLQDTFGWYRHVVFDSRERIALVELAVNINKFPARKLRKMVRELGASTVYKEMDIKGPDDPRCSSGGWELVVIDRRYQVVSMVLRLDEEGEPVPLLIPACMPRYCRGHSEINLSILGGSCHIGHSERRRVHIRVE